MKNLTDRVWTLPRQEHDEVTEEGMGRILTLSDGVFAIALTLLILEIAVPAATSNQDLPSALLHLWPRYVAYVLSFLVISRFWITHHVVFRLISHADPVLVWLNLLMLMFVAFLPFPTAVLGEHEGVPAATVLYAASVCLAGTASAAYWWYASGRGGLLRPGVGRAQVTGLRTRSLVGPVFFALTLPVAAFAPYPAEVVWVLVFPVTRVVYAWFVAEEHQQHYLSGKATMAEDASFTIGAQANCTDGSCGHLTKMVVDPVKRAVTHLVIKPQLGQGPDRLVPIELAEAGPDSVRLRCSKAEFEQLDPAEENEFLPGPYGYAPYGPAGVALWPYYGLGSTAMNAEIAAVEPHIVTVDAVPLDEVEIRRGDHVHATDGSIGRVQGLVFEPASHHVTHVLLQEGHIWGRKQVAIPIGAVSAIEDEGIRLTISRSEVEHLPPVALDHPADAAAAAGASAEVQRNS
jgi:uncharacterized membrane protein